jgi:hypothetical protein
MVAACFQTVPEILNRSLYLSKIHKMKSFIEITVTLALISFTGCTGFNQDKGLTVMTFNVRYDNPGDSVNAWPNRVALVCDMLKKERPDLLGLQEALWYQYEAIDSAISGYSSVSRGRDDGKKEGPLFVSDHWPYKAVVSIK